MDFRPQAGKTKARSALIVAVVAGWRAPCLKQPIRCEWSKALLCKRIDSYPRRANTSPIPAIIIKPPAVRKIGFKV